MKTFLKKFVLSCLVFVLLAFSFAPTASAQTDTGTWYNQTFKEWYTKVNNSPENEIFGERYTAAQVEWVIYGLFAFVLNKTTGDPNTTTCLMNNDLNDCLQRLTDMFSSVPAQQQTLYNKGFLAFLFADRPLSAITYFRNWARSLHLVPQAEAQQPGFGFSALDPVLPLWKVSRNTSYALFVLVILVLAFMIMFRVKISPQVVISVQSALPKVVFALILVTFSYAIAGFLIDLMYVVFGLVSLIISQAFTSLDAPAIAPGTIFGFLTQGFLGTGIAGILTLYLILFFFVSAFVLIGANGLGGVVLGSLLGFNAVLTLIALLLTIVLAILLLFITVKIIWMLLKAFVSILLLVIIAPFQIALGVVLTGVGFNAWLRSFISNLAVFPLTGLLVALSYIFLGMAVGATMQGLHGTISQFFQGIGFSLPGLNFILAAAQHQGWPPMLVFGVQNTFGILSLGVSVVILFILPKTADIIKSMIEGKPFAFGMAIGEEVAGPYKMAMGTPTARAIQEYGGLSSGAWLLGQISSRTGLFKESAAALQSRKEQYQKARQELTGTAPER